MTPEKVIEEVKKSGLRGRGGAGFPTGEKWELAAGTPVEKPRINLDKSSVSNFDTDYNFKGERLVRGKYFICNLDESEPGVYKDRTIAEKNPHQIIEGLLIGAYAIGAKKAFIYINGHYQKQAEILEIALEQAREKEFVGRGIMGSAIDIEVEIFEGRGSLYLRRRNGAYEHHRRKKRRAALKPPYPPVAGLFGKPTIVNNAETLANIPYIIRQGAKIFSQIGSSVSPGTKLFVLEGAVKNQGNFRSAAWNHCSRIDF